MGSRVEYEVRKLPDDYVTYETVYDFVDDEKARPDRWGHKRQKMIPRKVESRGGFLYIIRGKPGHSIRLTSLDQMHTFGLREIPRVIDNESGEEVGPDGVPLSVKAQLNASRHLGNMSGPYGTDIDVSSVATGDEEFGLPEEGDELTEGVRGTAGPHSVENQIADLEE